MAIRERSQSFVGPVGTALRWQWDNGAWHLITNNSRSITVSSKHMEDTTGSYGGVNPATTTKLTREGGIITRLHSQGFSRWAISNYPCGYIVGAITNHLVVNGSPSFGEAATEIASRTNPSQPSVNLPVSIAELRELPSLLRMRGGSGNSVLTSEFGWQPMLQDVRAIFNLPQSIESRIKTINALKNGPVSRSRTVFSGSRTQENSTSRTLNSDTGTTITSNREVTQTLETVRGAIAWKPNFDVPSLTDRELWKLAARVTTGIDSGNALNAVWNLLPWSWLIDYFGNLGDLISLTNNSLASPAGPAAISRVRLTTRTIFPTGFAPGATCTPLIIKLRDWERFPASPIASFRLPLLTNGQVSILSNLAFGKRVKINQ